MMMRKNQHDRPTIGLSDGRPERAKKGRFFVGVCRIAESEGRAVDFGDLVPSGCVLRCLSKELFDLVFPALDTWKTVKDLMASEGNSWSLVRSEDLPEGLFDRDESGCSLEETPSVSSVDIRFLITSSFKSLIQTRERASPNMVTWLFIRLTSEQVLRFPMQPFMRELLDRLNLSPGQLAPNAWRTIAVSLGFWTLNVRQRNLKLITGLPSSNREWKDDYIFVCGDNWEDLPWEEKDDNFVRVRCEWGVPSSSNVCVRFFVCYVVYRMPGGSSLHYAKFIHPDSLALYSFGPKPSQDVLSQDLINQQRMATAKLNKEKLKKMMGQKDEVSISLGNRRKTDLSSKKVAEESGAPLPKAQEPTLSEPTLASSVELVEVPSASSSSKVVEKAPILPKNTSLALRRAKSVVTKEDVD
uniref:Uncharacterized protein n=1 Tax=Fagus sylvatica TaxID=28930 RepID=A0A2N9H4A5_FAGSY